MEILGKYIYDPQTDLLGRGGFATVYKAFDKVLEMPVALKFFHPQDQGNKYTIINEIKRAIVLSHPNIVKYYGVDTLVNRNYHGQDEEVQIGIMEFVQEGQLKTYMTAHPLNKPELNKLLIDVLEGLKYLHNEGIIHRDIKPQNILLGRDKHAKLIAKIADFGISKSADSNQASASVLLGTIEYMAPEQFNPERYGINKKVTYNVDIWAFGVTAYYLITGDLMFGTRSGDTSAAQLINKIVNVEGLDARLSSLDEPYRSLLSKCIVTDAKERTSDVDELLSILRNFGKPVIAPTPTPIIPTVAYPVEPILPTGGETQVIENVKSNKSFTPNTDGETQVIDVPKENRKKAANRTHQTPSNETQAIDAPSNFSSNSYSNSSYASTQKVDVGSTEVLNLNELDDGETASKSSKKIMKWLAIVVLVTALGGTIYYFATKKTTAETNTASAKDAADNMAKIIEASMVKIASGDFIMGSSSSDFGIYEKPEHSVKVNAYQLLSTEVTRRMWNDIMGDNKYTDTTTLDFPANNVSWNDAKIFIKKLNLLSKINYRLPTETEWEFAAVTGTKSLDKTKSTWKNDISWNGNNSNNTIHAVKTKTPDNLGLYDMLGNLCEWCEDWFAKYLTGEKPEGLDGRVLRGGDFQPKQGDKDFPYLVSTKARSVEDPNAQSNNIGFRLAADQ